MAGDWLKMDSSTPDKPEVLAITARMGWDDPDLTVGKLFRVWRWFDQHTVDGNAPGVTSALLDRIAGVSGFADAMRTVGWLIVTDDGLSLPKFDRHNGATAKARAQTAKRVASHRGNGDGNADSNAASVTGALAREEKRREETSSLRSEVGRASRLPSDWTLPDDWAEWARAERPDLDPVSTSCAFRDYWVAKAGKDGRKADWLATWRNWVRNQRSMSAQRGAGPIASKQSALEARNAATAARFLEKLNAAE